VFVVIDEFQRMVAHNVEYMLQLARSMGVGIILANQSLQDLGELLPAVEANCRYRQWFAVSSLDDRRRLIESSGETVEHLTDNLGAALGRLPDSAMRKRIEQDFDRTVTAPAAGGEPDSAPARGTLVLLSLILVAAVANLNLAVANVALPDIGKAFDSSQTTLDLIAVGYSLGLAASVLYLGAVGDRYGRKTLLIAGTLLSIPACLVAAWAPSDVVLVVARIVGGLSAGMAYPTTLALITALWSGPGRTMKDILAEIKELVAILTALIRTARFDLDAGRLSLLLGSTRAT
jgi:hypothetical protein